MFVSFFENSPKSNMLSLFEIKLNRQFFEYFSVKVFKGTKLVT